LPQLAQVSLMVRARVYAMVLAGGYLAAVLSHGWAVAKVAGDVARAVVSAQRLQAAAVVGDVVPAAA
jgi:hypothetical protein